MMILLTLIISALGSINGARGEEFGSSLYIPGFQGPMAGYQPDPGTYLKNDFYWYQGNATKLLLNGRVQFNMRTRLLANLTTLFHVTNFKIFNANYGASLIWADIANSFMKSEVEIDLRRLGRTLNLQRQEDYTGVGDLIATPLMLGWHVGQFHLMAFGNLYCPTGAYNVHRVVNTSLHRWAVEPNLAVTWLDPKRGHEASLALGYTINFENSATNYLTGNEFHLDFYLGQHLPKGFNLGLAGFLLKQTTPDSGSGAHLGKFYGFTFGLGPCLQWNFTLAGHPLLLGARYYNELAVHNRTSGQSMFGTFSFGF